MHFSMRCVVILVCFLLGSTTVSARENEERLGFGIGTPIKSSDLSNVSREYYSRLRVNVVKPTFPAVSGQSKHLRAFLSVFGASQSQSRTINVTLKVRSDKYTMPEQVLISYRMDSKTGAVSATINDGVQFPTVRLDTDDSIHIEVDYRDAKSTEIDVSGVGKSVAALLPGSSLLSSLGSPYVNQVASLSSSIFSSMHTGTTVSAYSNQLSPHGVGIKKIELPLKMPNGTALGTISLYLEVKPSLTRNFTDVSAASNNDFVQVIGEDMSTLMTSLGGTNKTYLEELRSLETFPKLVLERNTKSIDEFCDKGRDSLNKHGLGLMDRSQLLLLAMDKAGFADYLGETAWFYSCFEEPEIDMLAKVRGLKVPRTSATIPLNLLLSLGCWMQEIVEPRCTKHAPNAEKVLNNLLAEDVEITIDSGFLGPAVVGEATRVARIDLMTSLKSSASAFRCLDNGMTVVNKAGDVLFRLRGRWDSESKKLTHLDIRPAPQADSECRV